METVAADRSMTGEMVPLTALTWSPGKVLALVAWAAGLNFGQAFALRTLDVSALPGQLPYFIRAAVVLGFYAAIAAPVVISARRQGLRLSEAVGLRPVSWGTGIGLAAAAVLAARLLAVAWAVAATVLRLRLPGGSADITSVFGSSPMGIAVTVTVAILVGPFVEELVFRGVTFAQLERFQGTLGAIVGSSALFGLLHVNPLELIPLMLAGALFAWVFKVSRSLWTAIIAHGAFNLVAVIALYTLKAVGR